MWSMEIIVMDPSFVGFGPLGLIGIRPRVGLLSIKSPVEPFDLPIRLRPIGPRRLMLDSLAECLRKRP